MRTLLCVCPPRVESLFSAVLSKSCNQILVAFKVWFSRNSSSRGRTPRLGSLTWGSELSLQWMDFCGISVLQCVSHPPSSYGIWFYCDCTPPTVSLWLLLCLWMWGIFFSEFQCLPVNDCSAVSCDSGVLTRGSECTSFYSAILNQSPCLHSWMITFSDFDMHCPYSKGGWASFHVLISHLYVFFGEVWYNSFAYFKLDYLSFYCWF